MPGRYQWKQFHTEDREVHEELRHLTSRPDRFINHTEADSHLHASTVVEKNAEKSSCTTFKGCDCCRRKSTSGDSRICWKKLKVPQFTSVVIFKYVHGILVIPMSTWITDCSSLPSYRLLKRQHLVR
ncbi:hypothetical protein TNIN_410821 [Trichonephila inaurata madagascariensis]|uniref:Uncharacterized protein n=1 Tax=Trichonephila inaurata madagascariensis TaxID=2747483 RepID=A0A8X6Y927_9ARAC|nr:hypothetical protein TNIN_410821 [Trichonephila inaurata madagascariensis]